MTHTSPKWNKKQWNKTVEYAVNQQSFHTQAAKNILGASRSTTAHWALGELLYLISVFHWI